MLTSQKNLMALTLKTGATKKKSTVDRELYENPLMLLKLSNLPSRVEGFFAKHTFCYTTMTLIFRQKKKGSGPIMESKKQIFFYLVS